MSTLIRFRVPDEWIDDMEQAAGDAGFDVAKRGKTGGVSAWVRWLVLREIGREYECPHGAQARLAEEERKMRLLREALKPPNWTKQQRERSE